MKWHLRCGKSPGMQRCVGYALQVVREVRCVFSWRLKVSNVLYSLTAAGNSFQIVAAEKLRESPLKLLMLEGIYKRL